MESKMNQSKKQRKVSSGPIRDKARTMNKIVWAVGEVLKKDGYQALDYTSIAKVAAVDRRLLTLYFGNLDNLVYTYLKNCDYWQTKDKDRVDSMVEKSPKINSKTITHFLQDQFQVIKNQEVLQNLIHWELVQKNPALQELANSREDHVRDFLIRLEDQYSTPEKDFKAMLAIQAAGLYFLSLYSKNNNSPFYGVDLSNKQGIQRIHNAIGSLMELILKK